MEFDGFDWDWGNREKCQKHGVSLSEIESVFARPVIILPDKENLQDERRFRRLSAAETGGDFFGRERICSYPTRPFRIGSCTACSSAMRMKR